MAPASEEEANPSEQTAFDVSGRLQNRGGPNRLEQGERKTTCLSWRAACGPIRSRCRRGSGGSAEAVTDRPGIFYTGATRQGGKVAGWMDSLRCAGKGNTRNKLQQGGRSSTDGSIFSEYRGVQCFGGLTLMGREAATSRCP